MTDYSEENIDSEKSAVHNRFLHFPSRLSPLVQDIFLCVGITFASAMFGFDSYVDDAVMQPIRLAALLLMLINWCRAAYSSGKNRRDGFILFMGIYWLMPPALKMFSEISGGEETARIITEFSNILVYYPFSFFTELFDGRPDEWLYCASMLGIMIAGYVIGAKKSEK